MLAMNIIMVASFFPAWFLVYFMAKNYAEPKKNIIIGTTLPQEIHSDEQVEAISKSFHKWLNITMFPMLPALFVPFFTQSMGLATTWYMTWLLALIVALYGVFAHHRGKLMKLKRENNWYGESTGETFADIKAATLPVHKISSIWFLLPTLISFIPVIYTIFTGAELASMILYTSFALTTLLLWPFYYLIFRVRSEVVNDDLTLTMALTRMRRYNWGKMWIALIWATGLLNILLWLFPENSIAFLIIILTYSAALIFMVIKVEFDTRTSQQNLTADNIGELYLDEDDYWIGGLFYHNPNDTHFMVNYRVGMGMTVNLAKLGAKILMGFALISIIAMPFIGIWVLVEEQTPVQLVLTETEVVARHTTVTYTIPISDIDSIELYEELPWIIGRTAGTGLPNVNKGRFTVSGYGATNLNIHPEHPPFLLITAGERTYLLNDANSSITREIYDSIVDYKEAGQLLSSIS